MMMTVFCTVLPRLSESVITKKLTHHLYQIPASKMFKLFLICGEIMKSWSWIVMCAFRKLFCIWFIVFFVCFFFRWFNYFGGERGDCKIFVVALGFHFRSASFIVSGWWFSMKLLIPGHTIVCLHSNLQILVDNHKLSCQFAKFKSQITYWSLIISSYHSDNTEQGKAVHLNNHSSACI